MPEKQPWEYSLYVPNDPRAVTVSRRTLRLILTVHGLIRLVDTAELVAAELVANAVRHTEGPAALRVGCSRSGPGTPILGRPSRRGRSICFLTRRRGAGWPWSGPVPRSGGGSPSPGTAVGASTSGAN